MHEAGPSPDGRPYRAGMDRRAWRVFIAIVLVTIGVVVVRTTSVLYREPQQVDDRFPGGRWVTVKPPLGLVKVSITEYLSDEEMSVVRNVQRMIDDIELRPPPSFDGYDLRWHVEPAALRSTLFAVQKRVLAALDAAISPGSPFLRDWPIDIVVGRSQTWLRRILRERGCNPNLASWNGVILMAAAVCNRRFIVSNITGLLFVVRAEQRITAELERRREPPVSAVPYRLVARGATALAHEYAHLWRAAGPGGLVLTDEPAWYSEGLAEFWGGVAFVLAYRGRLNYETQHVVRVRDFFDWSRLCDRPLSAYQTYSPLNNGCEYHVGLMALELLYSRYSDLQTTLDSFDRATEFRSFADWFAASFGVSLTDFEAEANRYISRIRRVELAQARVLSPR